MSLLVLEPGIESRIVDLGRPGTRSLGVPVSGAADRRSFMLGNSLVGNPPNAPALEIALKGPSLRAEADVGGVLFGAPFEIHCDGYPLEVNRTFAMKAGQELRIGGTGAGARGYLCVCGGFDPPAILDSQSGLETVRASDLLGCAASRIQMRYCPDVKPFLLDDWSLMVVPGLQASWFNEEEFFEQTFTLTPASNRMGLRLKGKPLTMPNRELVSEAVSPGAIQVTRDGQCIVLGADGQTIGGYPKIAHVIQADLDALGQLRPGQRVRFVKIELREAIARDRIRVAELRDWSLRLRTSCDAF